MHASEPGKPAFLLDLIEPERPKVDAEVLRLIRQQPLASADFIIRPNGSCRLSPQFARTVATLILTGSGVRMVARKTRRKRRPVEEWGNFLFAIEKVHSHYSFGDGSHLDRTAYSECLQPEVEATCVAPEKFKGSNDKVHTYRRSLRRA